MNQNRGSDVGSRDRIRLCKGTKAERQVRPEAEKKKGPTSIQLMENVRFR